jgi:integrase
VAHIRVFVATGARLSEIADLRWTPGDATTNDVDLDAGLMRVMGSDAGKRITFLSPKAVKALDRDRRAR